MRPAKDAGLNDRYEIGVHELKGGLQPGESAEVSRATLFPPRKEGAMKTTSTRRGSLKGTTGAGLLICSSRVAFGYEANERLNIACIGIGGVTRRAGGVFLRILVRRHPGAAFEHRIIV